MGASEGGRVQVGARSIRGSRFSSRIGFPTMQKNAKKCGKKSKNAKRVKMYQKFTEKAKKLYTSAINTAKLMNNTKHMNKFPKR